MTKRRWISRAFLTAFLCGLYGASSLAVPLSTGSADGAALGDSDGGLAVGESLIWVALPAELPAGPHRLQTEIRLDGELIAEEDLELSWLSASTELSAASLPRAVELLSHQPRQRARLVTLAGDRSRQVTVSTRLNGEPWIETKLDALLDRAAETLGEGFLPVEARPEAVTPEIVLQKGIGGVLASSPDPACVQQCGQYQAACASQCVPETIDCLEYCDQEYNDCVGSCPTTCTGPTVRDYDSYQTVLFNYHGVAACLSHPFYGKTFWGRYSHRQKVTTYRETTQCNGTVTTTVLSVVYLPIRTCWAQFQPASFCSPSSGSSLNVLNCLPDT